MSDIRRITLTDGRILAGSVVIDGPDHLDLVWNQDGVNHQVSIPRDIISEEEDAGPRQIRPDGDGLFVCRTCLQKTQLDDMSFGYCRPCYEKTL